MQGRATRNGVYLVLCGLVAMVVAVLMASNGLVPDSRGGFYVVRQVGADQIESFHCSKHAEPAEDARCPDARRKERVTFWRTVLLLPGGAVCVLIGLVWTIREARRSRRDRDRVARAAMPSDDTPWTPDESAWEQHFQGLDDLS